MVEENGGSLGFILMEVFHYRFINPLIEGKRSFRL